MVSLLIKKPLTIIFYLSIVIVSGLIVYLIFLSQTNKEKMTETDLKNHRKRIQFITRVLIVVIILGFLVFVASKRITISDEFETMLLILKEKLKDDDINVSPDAEEISHLKRSDVHVEEGSNFPDSKIQDGSIDDKNNKDTTILIKEIDKTILEIENVSTGPHMKGKIDIQNIKDLLIQYLRRALYLNPTNKRVFHLIDTLVKKVDNVEKQNKIDRKKSGNIDVIDVVPFSSYTEPGPVISPTNTRIGSIRKNTFINAPTATEVVKSIVGRGTSALANAAFMTGQVALEGTYGVTEAAMIAAMETSEQVSRTVESIAEKGKHVLVKAVGKTGQVALEGTRGLSDAAKSAATMVGDAGTYTLNKAAKTKDQAVSAGRHGLVEAARIFKNIVAGISRSQDASNMSGNNSAVSPIDPRLDAEPNPVPADQKPTDAVPVPSVASADEPNYISTNNLTFYGKCEKLRRSPRTNKYMLDNVSRRFGENFEVPQYQKLLYFKKAEDITNMTYNQLLKILPEYCQESDIRVCQSQKFPNVYFHVGCAGPVQRDGMRNIKLVTLEDKNVARPTNSIFLTDKDRLVV